MKKILLISNEDAFLERNRKLFAKSGFHVLQATSAEEALLIHRHERVHLIVSALDLPDVGGDLLCALIRQDKELKNVSVILVCFPTAKAVQRAAHCGANAWIAKPVRPEDLLEQACRFLRVAERREHRVPFRGCVQSPKHPEIFYGVSRNISTSGMLCETETHLKKNEVIKIRYKIGARSIEAEGKVVRSVMLQPGLYNYGVEFVNLDASCREGIEKFVTSLRKAG